MAAPRFSLEMDGLAELRETLERILPGEAEKILRETVHNLGARVAEALQRAVKKDTRQAERSIRVRKKRGQKHFPEAEVRGGASAPYLLMLEFGTRRTRAQPFITPTVEQTRPDLPRVYREEFAQALEKALARKRRRDERAERAFRRGLTTVSG